MNRTIWILGGVFVVLLVVLIFFLNSDGGSGDGSTTSILAGDTTTTTIEGSSTTTTTPDSGATTTTAPGDTTTTAPGETTTTALETTTTSEASDGEWADEPLVVAGWGALGWFDGSSWVQAENSLPVVGGESYQIAALDLQAVTTGGPQELLCEPLDNVGVQLAHDELLGEWPGPYGVAISAPWDLTPHIVEPFSDDGTYAAIASDLLADRGLDVPNPVIKQLLRVDLEGDGVNEILVVAEDLTSGLTPVAGDYSMIFMSKVIQGDVQVAVLGEAIVFDPDFDFILAFSVGSVSDLSGDGKMEIVVSTAHFEGLGVEVFEYVNDDIGPLSQITAGCGS